jgi:hypothetical protein
MVNLSGSIQTVFMPGGLTDVFLPTTAFQPPDPSMPISQIHFNIQKAIVAVNRRSLTLYMGSPTHCTPGRRAFSPVNGSQTPFA